MAQPLRSKTQTWCLFAALVIGAVLIAICGVQWLQRGFNEMQIRSFSYDGTKFVADAGHQLVGGSKFGVYDSASGDLLCDLRDNYHHREHAWSSDDKKLVSLFYGTRNQGPGIAVLVVTGSEAKVLRTWSIASGRTYCVFFDSQDRVVQIDRVLAPSRSASTAGSDPKRSEFLLGAAVVETSFSFEFSLRAATYANLELHEVILTSEPGGFRLSSEVDVADVSNKSAELQAVVLTDARQ